MILYQLSYQGSPTANTVTFSHLKLNYKLTQFMTCFKVQHKLMLAKWIIVHMLWWSLQINKR